MGYRNQPTSVSGVKDVSDKGPTFQDRALLENEKREAERKRLADINKKREESNWRIEQEESLYSADLQAGIRTAANKTNVDYTSLNDSMSNMVSQLSAARIRLKQSSGPYEEMDPEGNVVFNTQTDKSYIKSATDFIKNSETNFGSVAYIQEEFKKMPSGNGEGETSRKFTSPYLGLLNAASNPASGQDVSVSYDMEYDNKSGHRMGIVMKGEAVRRLNAEMGNEGDTYTIKPEEVTNLMMGNNDPENFGLFYQNPSTVSELEKKAATNGILDDGAINSDYMIKVDDAKRIVDELTGTEQMATVSQVNYPVIKQNMAGAIKSKLMTTLDKGMVSTSVLINTYAKQDEDGNYYYDTPRKDGNGNIIYKANGKVDFGGVNEVEYVNLSEIEGWGDGGDISNPVVNANIKDGVSKMFSDNKGLTVTGATRSEELQKKLTEGGVGAEKNSRHLTGYGLDLRANAESEALLKKLNSNDGEYMKELGIKKAFFHGEGGNKHLHIGFKRGESEVDTRNRVYLGDGELEFDMSSDNESFGGLSEDDYNNVYGLIENEFMKRSGVYDPQVVKPYGEKMTIDKKLSRQKKVIDINKATATKEGIDYRITRGLKEEPNYIVDDKVIKFSGGNDLSIKTLKISEGDDENQKEVQVFGLVKRDGKLQVRLSTDGDDLSESRTMVNNYINALTENVSKDEKQDILRAIRRLEKSEEVGSISTVKEEEKINKLIKETQLNPGKDSDGVVTNLNRSLKNKLREKGYVISGGLEDFIDDSNLKDEAIVNEITQKVITDNINKVVDDYGREGNQFEFDDNGNLIK